MMTSSEWAIAMEAFPAIAAVGGVLYCVTAPVLSRLRRTSAKQRRRDAEWADIRASEAAARVLQQRRMRERYPQDDGRIFTAS